MTGYVSVVSPLINYGLGHISGALSPWRYMYLVAGAITVIWAFVILFLMPPDPIRAKRFTDRERYIAVARLRTNNSGVRNTHFKLEQVRELLLDLRFWLVFIMAFTMLVRMTLPQLRRLLTLNRLVSQNILRLPVLVNMKVLSIGFKATCFTPTTYSPRSIPQRPLLTSVSQRPCLDLHPDHHP